MAVVRMLGLDPGNLLDTWCIQKRKQKKDCGEEACVCVMQFVEQARILDPTIDHHMPIVPSQGRTRFLTRTDFSFLEFGWIDGLCVPL
jgi:hypothetical protein